jgi:hypothetical protein
MREVVHVWEKGKIELVDLTIYNIARRDIKWWNALLLS